MIKYKLLYRGICKNYKITSHDIIRKINLKAKEIIIKYNLDGLTEPLTVHRSKITIKDYKDNFISNPTLRLICPSTSDIGKLKKVILGKYVD